MRTYDLVVIGGGSAGMAAAVSAYDNGIKDIVILEKDAFLGGILQQCIHNGFGLHTFKEQLSGPEYAQRFIEMVNDRHIEYKLMTTVIGISKEKDIYYSNSSDGFMHVKAKAIVLATGCSERTAGAIQLCGDRASGVLTAGQAQRYLNIDGYMVGKKVFILGSGDIGLIMARRLTLEGATVLGVAELMPYSNGLTRNIVQCLNDFNIPLYLSHTVKKVIGKDHVEKVIISPVDAKFNYIEGQDKEFDVDTLILSVGLIPYNVLLDNIGCKLNGRTKGADVDEYCQLDIPGIFACGNTLHVHDLVDYVSEESTLAGKGAAKYILGLYQVNDNNTSTLALNNVSYIVPQHYHYENVETNITFKFRVLKPILKGRIIIKNDDVVIKSLVKMNMVPAEMEMITVNKELLKENSTKLTIEIEEL